MPTTPDSFNSISFRALINGTSQDREGRVSERGIPWANENIIQTGGRAVTHATIRALFTSDSNFTSIKQNVGTQASLSYHDFSGTATLRNVSNVQFIKGQNRIITLFFLLDSD